MTTPLIMLPGLTANASLLEFQSDVFPQMIVPEWPPPKRRETLASYGKRLAEQVDPGVPCFVGGVSFGGIVALEMALHLQTLGCVLISSMSSPKQLPRMGKAVRPIAVIGPEVLGPIGKVIATASRPALSRGARMRLTRLSHPSRARERWGLWAVIRWKPSAYKWPFPVHQIHGSADKTIRPSRQWKCTLVEGAGHMMVMTHAGVVNDFMKLAMADAGSE
jgi:pimeloyl-ACP methyl ester carboxylesterase